MLQETLRQLYPELTRSQRRLADFIAESYREAAFMTAARMAQRLSLNEATVIRFAQRLGYDGYPDLIADVRLMVTQELRAPQPCDDNKTPSGLRGQLVAQLTEAQRFVSHIPAEIANKALEKLLSASRIYVLGQGLAAAPAQTLSLALRSCGLVAECPSTDPMCLGVLRAEMDKGTLALAISLDDSPQIAGLLASVREQGIDTLVLSYSSLSPCAQSAETALICGQNDANRLPPLTPIAVTIDALIQTIIDQLGEKATTRLATIREMQQAMAPRHDVC